MPKVKIDSELLRDVAGDGASASDAVANQDSLQVHVRACASECILFVVRQDLQRQHRNVRPSVRFASNVKVVGGKLGKAFQELRDCRVVIGSCARVVVLGASRGICVAEADPCRRLQKDDIGDGRPPVLESYSGIIAQLVSAQHQNEAQHEAILRALLPTLE